MRVNNLLEWVAKQRKILEEGAGLDLEPSPAPVPPETLPEIREEAGPGPLLQINPWSKKYIKLKLLLETGLLSEDLKEEAERYLKSYDFTLCPLVDRAEEKAFLRRVESSYVTELPLIKEFNQQLQTTKRAKGL